MNCNIRLNSYVEYYREKIDYSMKFYIANIVKAHSWTMLNK